MGEEGLFLPLTSRPFVILQCVATEYNLVLSGCSQIKYSHEGKVSKKPRALLFTFDNLCLLQLWLSGPQLH